MPKIDLDSIVKNVKQMINPTGQTPQAEAGDALGIKLAKLSTSIQLVAQIQAEQTKEFAKINKLANEIFEDIQASKETEAQSNETGDQVSMSEHDKPEKRSDEDA